MPHRVRLSPQQVVEIDDAVERRTATALLAAKLGVFEYEPQRDIAFWDDRVHELWGLPNDEVMTYEKVLNSIHPDDRDQHTERYQMALVATGSRHFDFEYRIFPADGSPMRWIHAQADCMFQGDLPVRLVGTVQDVTERRSAEERAKILVDELEHRVKNTLNSVISLVSLSGKGHTDLKEYLAALRERLHSMAHAHDLLRGNDWQPIRLSELLKLYTEGVLGPSKDRVKIHGPEPLLQASYTPTIAMAFHELFTNAMKYGALSDDASHIEVQSFVTPEHVGFVWQEHLTEPMMTEPNRSGFGSFLLTQVLPRELGGTGEVTFLKQGMCFRLQYPATRTLFA